MEFTTAERGARKLLKDGYINLLKKLCKWNNFVGVRECRASVKLDELDNFVEQVNEHAHPPSATKCEKTKIKEKSNEEHVQEQRLHCVNFFQVLSGHPAPPVWRQYFDVNQRLIRFLDNFLNLDAMQYLRSIACNLGLH